MSKLLVLIIKTEPGSTDNNIENLKNVFSDPFFNLNVVNVSPPAIIQKTKNLSNYDILTLNRVKKSLNYANSKFKDFYTLLILDTSMTYETASSMKDKIERVMNLDFDILYLCKWYEDCQNILKSQVSNVYKTTKPKGFQSALFSPNMIKIVLSDDFNSAISFPKNVENLIASDKIKAYSYTPNLVNFDIEFAKINEEYLKLNEFSPLIKRSPNESISYIWFIFLLLLIIVTAYVVIKIGPNDDKKKEIL